MTRSVYKWKAAPIHHRWTYGRHFQWTSSAFYLFFSCAAAAAARLLASGNNKNNLISFFFSEYKIQSIYFICRYTYTSILDWTKCKCRFLNVFLLLSFIMWKFTCKQLSEFRADTVRPKMDKILSYRLVMNRPSIDAAEPETIQSVWTREITFLVYNFHNPLVVQFLRKNSFGLFEIFRFINSNSTKCVRKNCKELIIFFFFFVFCFVLFQSTSGCGLPWPEHSMWPPVLLENSILCGGSCEKTGPCKSSCIVSTKWGKIVEIAT